MPHSPGVVGNASPVNLCFVGMHGADVRNVTFLKGARWGYPADYPVEAVDDEFERGG